MVQAQNGGDVGMKPRRSGSRHSSPSAEHQANARHLEGEGRGLPVEVHSQSGLWEGRQGRGEGRGEGREKRKGKGTRREGEKSWAVMSQPVVTGGGALDRDDQGATCCIN